MAAFGEGCDLKDLLQSRPAAAELKQAEAAIKERPLGAKSSRTRAEIQTYAVQAAKASWGSYEGKVSRRIGGEIAEYLRDERLDNFTLALGDGGVLYAAGVATLPGNTTKYAVRSILFIKLRYPPEYPFRAPSIYILSPIFHVNVDFWTGRVVGTKVFYKDYSPGTHLSSTLDMLRECLQRPELAVTDEAESAAACNRDDDPDPGNFAVDRDLSLTKSLQLQSKSWLFLNRLTTYLRIQHRWARYLEVSNCGSIASYSIPETLNAVPFRHTITVSVRTLTLKRLTFSCQGLETVAKLKLRVQLDDGIPAEVTSIHTPFRNRWDNQELIAQVFSDIPADTILQFTQSSTQHFFNNFVGLNFGLALASVDVAVSDGANGSGHHDAAPAVGAPTSMMAAIHGVSGDASKHRVMAAAVIAHMVDFSKDTVSSIQDILQQMDTDHQERIRYLVLDEASFDAGLEEYLLSPWEPGNPKYMALSQVLMPGETIDFFISHAWLDDPKDKLRVLRTLSTRHPGCRVWFDMFCIDQADIAANVRLLSLFASRCRQMLVLASGNYFRRMWCLVELYTLWALTPAGCRVFPMSVVDLEGVGSSNVAATEATVRNGLCGQVGDKDLLLHSINQLPGGAPAFDTAVTDVVQSMDNCRTESLASFCADADTSA